MSILKPDQSNIDQCAQILCSSFANEYRALFAVDPARMKPFVKMTLAKSESWVLTENGVAKGVLVLEHAKHKSASTPDTFKTLVRSLPFWSVVYSSRHLLVPKAKMPSESIHISQIAVGQSFRNNGIGLQLLEFAQMRAIELGLSSINLRVRGDNPAISLYRKLGFQTFKIYNSLILASVSGCPTSIFMVKNLVP